VKPAKVLQLLHGMTMPSNGVSLLGQTNQKPADSQSEDQVKSRRFSGFETAGHLLKGEPLTNIW
jgi:hypothetical protein